MDNGPALLIRFRAGDRRCPRKRRNPRPLTSTRRPTSRSRCARGRCGSSSTAASCAGSASANARSCAASTWPCARRAGPRCPPSSRTSRSRPSPSPSGSASWRATAAAASVRLGGPHRGLPRRPHHLHDGRRRGVDLPPQPHRLLRAPPGRGVRRPRLHRRDGRRRPASTAFPSLVAPHQPFRNVRAILHEVTPGVEVEVRMEGETFETEDQRNWSDASFKTYGTPSTSRSRWR